MRAIAQCTAVLAAALLLGQSLATPVPKQLPQPIRVTPGGVEDVVVTEKNTVNGTFVSNSINTTVDAASTTSGALTLEIVNNLAGSTSGQVHAYVIGTVNGAAAILKSDGTWYFPPDTTSQVPINITVDTAIPIDAKGSTTSVTIPSYVVSGRVYLADGDLQFFYENNGTGGATIVQPSSTNPSDPSADVNWGFVELTNTEVNKDGGGGLYANISYVDFVGLILGMSLTSTTGAVQSALGLSADAVSTICKALVKQTSIDGEAWASLCHTGKNGEYLRIIAPYDFMQTNTTAFSDYFSDYVDSVWTKYSSAHLTIETQDGNGNLTCTTGGTDTMTCKGSDKTFAKPDTGDIFGCNTGPFVVDGNTDDSLIVPRLCSAFNRATFLLDGGNVQPSLGSDSYYTVSPCNYYSKFVHENELDGKGYAFSYDDVNPTGSENASGELVSTTPKSLTITIGGPSTA